MLITDVRLLDEIALALTKVTDHVKTPLLPEHTFTGDLALSSLEMVKFALELERQLGIKIEERAEFRIRTVGEMLTYLHEKLHPSEHG